MSNCQVLTTSIYLMVMKFENRNDLEQGQTSNKIILYKIKKKKKESHDQMDVGQF